MGRKPNAKEPTELERAIQALETRIAEAQRVVESYEMALGALLAVNGVPRLGPAVGSGAVGVGPLPVSEKKPRSHRKKADASPAASEDLGL